MATATVGNEITLPHVLISKVIGRRHKHGGYELNTGKVPGNRFSQHLLRAGERLVFINLNNQKFIFDIIICSEDLPGMGHTCPELVAEPVHN